MASNFEPLNLSSELNELTELSEKTPPTVKFLKSGCDLALIDECKRHGLTLNPKFGLKI